MAAKVVAVVLLVVDVKCFQVELKYLHHRMNCFDFGNAYRMRRSNVREFVDDCVCK